MRCPDDGRLTRHRLCPKCKIELPQYVGQVQQNIVAVTGCRGSGKSVFHCSLLYQLREVLSREPDPFVLAMFEDDNSFAAYYALYKSLFIDGTLPEGTHVESQVEGNFEPIIVRLLQRRKGFGRTPHTNMVFYDHAGELVEALEKPHYLRYLVHSSALIYLVDLESRSEMAEFSLNAIIRHFRNSGLEGKIKRPLAIVLNKSDEKLFPTTFAEHGRSYLLPGDKEGAAFWHRWGARERAIVNQTSNRCLEYARSCGMNNLMNLARDNFANYRVFAVSPLGAAPSGVKLQTVEPLGVEYPLFWTLRN